MRGKWIKILIMAIGISFLTTSCKLQPTELNSTNIPSMSDEETSEVPKFKVGISMPTQSLQRWNQDGSNMKKQMEAAGYEVDLQYAGDNDIPTQISQLENMISDGCDVLVIAAIDVGTLTTVLEGANNRNIPVIAYDRLIMNSDAVSYYVMYGFSKASSMQGSFIEEALDLKNADGPFNIEFFTGAYDILAFHPDGIFEVLQPYLDSGKLVCRSGQIKHYEIATENWDTEIAKERMEKLIKSNQYGPQKTKLDAVWCLNDSIAQGVTEALLDAGYTPDNFPIITGHDCDVKSVKNMIASTQSMSIFKDTRILASRVVEMVISIAQGTEPEINDTKNYDNDSGKGPIPSYLCDPVVVTKENYREMLIDSNYYTDDEFKD